MCTSLAISSLPPANNSITGHLQEQNLTNGQTTQPVLFNNSSIPKESIFTRIYSCFLGTDYFVQDKWQQKPLPPLQEEQLSKIHATLTTERKIVLSSTEIKFNLNELFHHILNKKNPQATACIENIELVGGAVHWVLGSYLTSFLKHLDVENPNEWLSNELLQEYARSPKDFDFRIHMPKATVKDIEALKKAILEFFLEVGVKQNPAIETKEMRRLLLEQGFTNYTQPRDLDQGLFATVGFGDVDLVIYQSLPRESLFLSDNLFLPLIDMLKGHHSPIVPRSSFKNGSDAIFDRLSGIVRAINPQTINCAGWPCLLINFLKGKRCLTSSLETTLLNKTLCTLKGSYAETDCPKDLFKALRKLEQAPEPQRKACVMAYWLKKSLASHLHNNPSAAVMLTLQACLSLKMNQHEEVISELWSAMKPSTKGAESNPLLAEIIAVMDNGAGSFESLLALLQVKAFLSIHSGEKGTDFEANLIMHQGSPVIQAKIAGFSILLPYTPSQALLELKAQWEPLPAFENLNTFLQPTCPYSKQENTDSWTPFIWGIKPHFSKPWDKIAAEWFIASEIQHPTANGSKLIEDFLPDLLVAQTDKKQAERLLQSALNASKNSKLLNNICRALSGKAYASIPLPLIVAISLAANGDPASAYKAYSLWKIHYSSLPKDMSAGFTKAFIQQLSNSRPDLALNALSHLLEINPAFPEKTSYFNTILNSKNKFCITKNTLLLLAKAAKKTPTDLPFIQKLISELIVYKEECLEDIKSLWRLMYLEATDLEILKKPFQHHQELLAVLMDDSLSYTKVENSFAVLSSFKSSKATQWKKLFDQLNLSKNKELCQKTWAFFQTFLENPQNLKGTTQEIAEAWQSAIKTMVNKHPIALQDLLENEKKLILCFDHTQQTTLLKTAQVLFHSLMETSENHCSQEKLEKLLNLRQEFATVCQAPLGISKDWLVGDRLLIEKLALSEHISLKLTALKVYVANNDLKASMEIILFILKNEIPKNEIGSFAHALYLFLSKLPKEKHELVLKILQISQTGEILKHLPLQAFKILRDWQEAIMIKGNVESTKLTQLCFKHLIDLASLVDFSEVISWLSYLALHLECTGEEGDRFSQILIHKLASADALCLQTILNGILQIPLKPMLEIGIVAGCEALNSPARSKSQKESVAVFLSECQKIIAEKKHFFSTRLLSGISDNFLEDFDFKDDDYLPSFFSNIITTIHILILSTETPFENNFEIKTQLTLLKIIHNYMSGMNGDRKDHGRHLTIMQYHTDRIMKQYLSTSKSISEINQLFNIINQPYISKHPEIYFSCLKTAFSLLEKILVKNKDAFEESYKVLKGNKSDSKTNSLFIQGLLSIKFQNANAFSTIDRLISNEFYLQIENKKISDKDLHDYVFWTFKKEHWESINIFYSEASLWLLAHQDKIKKILTSLDNEFVTLNSKSIFQYYSLIYPELGVPNSVRLTDDQKNEAFKEIASLINIPYQHGSVNLVRMITTSPFIHALTASTILQIWKMIINSNQTIEQLGYITKNFLSQMNMSYKVFSFKEIAPDILELLVEKILEIYVLEHDSSYLPSLNITCDLLIQAVGKKLFSGEYARYFRLVEKLIMKFKLQAGEASITLLVNITTLIRMPNLTEQELFFQVQTMSKWVKLVATKNPGVAKNLILDSTKIFDNFPDELADLTQFINKLL